MASDGTIDPGGGSVGVSSIEPSRGTTITNVESDHTNKMANVDSDIGTGDMNNESDVGEGLMNVSDGGDGNISMESNTNSELMNTEQGEVSHDKELNSNTNSELMNTEQGQVSHDKELNSNEELDDSITCEETLKENESLNLESPIKTEATLAKTIENGSTDGTSNEAAEAMQAVKSGSNEIFSPRKSPELLQQPIQVPQATLSSGAQVINSANSDSNSSNTRSTNSATVGSARSQANYEELSEIGNGAYGTVYKARDLLNEGRVVALKKIRISLSDEGVPVNAVREIAMLKQLERYEHPNIVRLLDICHGQLEKESKLTLIMVFEFMEQDLDHYLKRCPSPGLEPARVKSIMHQILCGVDFLHSNRIIHRDLKPQNVLVDGQGRVKLADFGLARIYDFYMRLTTTVVTLWYRAPEVLLSNSYATPVDVWSCGCIFAELFRRKPIFEGRSEGDQLQIIFDTIGTPSETEWPSDVSLNRSNFRFHGGKAFKDVVPEITDYAEDLLKKMLTFRPEARIKAFNARNHPYFSGLVAPEVTPNSAPSSMPTQQIVSGPQYSTSNVLNLNAKLESSAVPLSNTNDENNPNHGNTQNMNNVTNIGNGNSDNMTENNNLVSKIPDDLGHSSASNSQISSSPMTNCESKDANQDSGELIR